MAAQIAEPTNASMSFNEEVLSPVSKLEAARKAAAADQQKRIDQAVARMASQKKENMGKRKVLEARLDGHRSKVQKTKTVVDVAQEKSGKKNSIARRLVDRFAADPEPEQEEPSIKEDDALPIDWQSHSDWCLSFLRRVGCMCIPHSAAQKKLNDTVEVTKVTTTTTTTTAEEESAVVSQEEDAEVAEESADWNGPTTNFHLKQLGLDDKVDIYAPVKVQQQEVRRIRERAMYLPESKSIATLETASDSENDSDFLPKEAEDEEDEDSDAESLPDVNAEETLALAEESEEYERTVAAEAAAVRRTLVKRVFVWTPLCVLAFVALVCAILFAIDWSQETFQFCPVDADSVGGSEELLSCASFVETQSLVKKSVREALEKAQSTVQSYLE
ncbi:hypothetical protein BBJ28_00006556 [Nothophytophthora sp. Chile5]|nr:hypothetical protein BBJ28_00006556 [Nothophytophthora sp. Chile5]